jgi:organic hydroperoxide reductase OsmC/OhrA
MNATWNPGYPHSVASAAGRVGAAVQPLSEYESINPKGAKTESRRDPVIAKAHTTSGGDEQLFAVGWSARFLAAINFVAAKQRIALEAVSHVCPYSLATKGNIDVNYSVVMSNVPAGAGQTQQV